MALLSRLANKLRWNTELPSISGIGNRVVTSSHSVNFPASVASLGTAPGPSCMGGKADDESVSRDKTSGNNPEQAAEAKLPAGPLESLLESSSPVPADTNWTTAVYPQHSVGKQSQARRSYRPAVDPRDTSILLFPGQGAQRVGMVNTLLPYPNVMDMFEEASSVLGYDLLKLCRDGPEKELDRTDRAQPAILVASLAAAEKLKEEQPRAIESCIAVAGFSVGELAALTFAGALRFNAAVKLAKIRGEAMQLASDLAPSGLMTVISRPEAKIGFACLLARQWCEEQGIENPVCSVANFLFPQCKVLAGNVEALTFIAERAQQFGLRRCTRLRVSGGFHSALMSAAVEPFQEGVKHTSITTPSVACYSNVSASRYRNPTEIRRKLVKQLTQPVKWEQIMHVLYERDQNVPFPQTFECGPGTTLKTVLGKVNAKAADWCKSVDQM